MKGIVLLSLYLLGFIFTLLTAFVMQKLLKSKETSFYIMEMPIYRWPLMRNVGLTVFNKVKVFIVGAGKIILAISIILWFLSNYSPTSDLTRIDIEFAKAINTTTNDSIKTIYTSQMRSAKLEASYIGHLGRAIEPFIKPLGYDWKIGIALITSFAAREVFVGTMSTIYGSTGNEEGIRQKLMNEKDENGNLKYSLAVCMSLAVFYVFAMQCMSTVAVVKRETKSWKWPIIQFVYLTALAYVGAWVVFSLLK